MTKKFVSKDDKKNDFSNQMGFRKRFIINDHVKCCHIMAGDYSYYSGYYHGHSFDQCVMYLDALDNEEKELDRLIIGKFCSIATGAKFMLGGTQGHNYE